MSSSLVLALLNPAIALVLAAAFLWLWLYQPRQRHHAGLAMGYALSAVGFLLQDIMLPLGFEVTRLLSAVAFLTAVVLVATCLLRRFCRRAPLPLLVGLAVIGLAAFAWGLFVEPDVGWRILALNLTLGAITLVTAAGFAAGIGHTRTGRVFTALTLVLAANFTVRPILLLLIEGDYATEAALRSSFYWTTSLLSHGVFSLLLALFVLATSALDALGRAQSDSLTDPLSGLYNRRGFETFASDLLKSCRTAGLPAALIVADLDHFKAINDRFGHAAGDRVIAEFALRLSMAVGNRGVAARVGGEEFALLLPLTDLSAARLMADAIRSVFAASPIPGLPQQQRVTASFGVVVRSGDETLEELIQRADEALYRAKRGGRDSVRLAWVRPTEPVRSSA